MTVTFGCASETNSGVHDTKELLGRCVRKEQCLGFVESYYVFSAFLCLEKSLRICDDLEINVAVILKLSV